MVQFSVIIPAFNEEKRIAQTVSAVADFFRPFDPNFELIIVDDGSTDQTAQILSSLKDNGVQVLHLETNQGKGRAVQVGMLKASGRWRLFMDADLATPLAEFKRFVTLLDEQTILIASRSVPGAEVIEPQSLMRRVGGLFGKKMIRALVLPEVRDSQCGFKVFPAEAAEQIFAQQTVAGWGFDFEVLALARALGYQIREVPVRWQAISDSRVRAKDYLKTLQVLLEVRRRFRTTKAG